MQGMWAKRCVSSKSAVGSKISPTEEELKIMQLSIENDGYVCGDKINGCGWRQILQQMSDEVRQLCRIAVLQSKDWYKRW
jgi:hypothetical protein